MTRRRGLTALLWAYSVFTVTALVCTAATDMMWEAYGCQYGAEPSALYEGGWRVLECPEFVAMPRRRRRRR